MAKHGDGTRATGGLWECISAGTAVIQPAWKGAPHSHPFTEILTIIGGRFASRIRGRAFTVGPGDILHYKPGSVHEERVEGRQQVQIAAVSLGPSFAGIPPFLHDRQGRIRTLAMWIAEEFWGHYRKKQELMDRMARAMSSEMERLATHPTPGFVEDTRYYARSRLGERLTITMLAKLNGMGRDHFIRKYKRATGLTPMRDIRQMRLQKARDILLSRNLPLKQVAAMVGFYDGHHLSHAFRRYLQVPPGYYRRHE